MWGAQVSSKACAWHTASAAIGLEERSLKKGRASLVAVTSTSNTLLLRSCSIDGACTEWLTLADGAHDREHAVNLQCSQSDGAVESCETPTCTAPLPSNCQWWNCCASWIKLRQMANRATSCYKIDFFTHFCATYEPKGNWKTSKGTKLKLALSVDLWGPSTTVLQEIGLWKYLEFRIVCE